MAPVLVEHWNGSKWTIVQSPNVPKSHFSSLNSIACVSAKSCMAVGIVAEAGGSNHPLTERWNGVRWSVETTPGPDAGSSPGAGAALAGIYCAEDFGCSAVGDYTNNKVGEYNTFVDHWNGLAWSKVPSPNQLMRVLG